MMYKNLEDAILDLDKTGQLLRISDEVDPNLEMAEIHRNVFEKRGPAILFEKVKGSPFKAVSNVFGTYERTDFLFRKTFPKIKKVIELKSDPSKFLNNPFAYLSAPFTALKALPLKTWSQPESMYGETTIESLPQIKSWPMDGGAFITLPQVCTLPPGSKKMMESNIGMYRVQLSGNDYILNKEIGMHYQLHRGIGVHHQAYNLTDEPFKVSIFIGGPPSHTFAAIMPMPEGLSELTFAGMLGGRRFRYYFDKDGHVISGDADFVITGTIEKNRKLPEGPFGDHLGYYSLTHDFPVIKVNKVYHRKDALWHFTVVGRPPQEDSSFGYLIHHLVKDLTAGEFPGVKAIHAVDAAGVHPLLLAIGKERYMPFREKIPEEIITIGNRILGSGQTSLAKYLFIGADEDDPTLDIYNVKNFFNHILERVDWERDLHFQTKTTIDTLDYSGSSWNGGSKVLVAVRGEIKRTLSDNYPVPIEDNSPIIKTKVIQKGILGVHIKPFTNYDNSKYEVEELINSFDISLLAGFPLIVVCDDVDFIAETTNNFVWVTFTRSNPSHDIYGIDSFTEFKHWGCKGSLMIDARKKPHHAPELVPDKTVSENVKKRWDFL
ncbi:MAG: UbiD family decarboxylase [Saprospiraceae bacterium]|nr:UbiD family decarboxylase [Saprospiraceae bacterium]